MLSDVLATSIGTATVEMATRTDLPAAEAREDEPTRGQDRALAIPRDGARDHRDQREQDAELGQGKPPPWRGRRTSGL